MTTEHKFKHLTRWTLPRNYAGAHWDNWYQFLGQSRDSGELERSNFDAGLAALQSVMSKEPVLDDDDECATVQVVREAHWFVGWVEWIAIHESDIAALECADQMLARLEDYPVLDEDLFSQYETEAANETWRNCYSPSERLDYIRQHRSQFEFRGFADLLGCVRGQYFAGYASELLN